MSAIWGAIDMQGREIPVNIQNMMRQSFDKCVIDRYEEICSGNVYMGCGIQYFVPEAREEQLPYTEDGIFYTADVVLDNREELCKRLKLSKEESRNNGYMSLLINEAVKNNPDKFPEDYMFALTPDENNHLRSKFSTANISPKSRSVPKVFTEKGLYMLAWWNYIKYLTLKSSQKRCKGLARLFRI